MTTCIPFVTLEREEALGFVLRNTKPYKARSRSPPCFAPEYGRRIERGRKLGNVSPLSLCIRLLSPLHHILRRE